MVSAVASNRTICFSHFPFLHRACNNKKTPISRHTFSIVGSNSNSYSKKFRYYCGWINEQLKTLSFLFPFSQCLCMWVFAVGPHGSSRSPWIRIQTNENTIPIQTITMSMKCYREKNVKIHTYLYSYKSNSVLFSVVYVESRRYNLFTLTRGWKILWTVFKCKHTIGEKMELCRVNATCLDAVN